MMLVTNLLCLGVGVALGMITLGRIVNWLCDKGRCEIHIIGEKGKLWDLGFIDDKIVDEAIEKLNND